MKKTKLISLVIAILVFVITLLNPFEDKSNKISDEDLVPVVMAVENISPQKLIESDLVYLKKIHKDSVPEGAITSMENVLGRVSRANIFSGDIFTGEKVYEVGEASGGLGYVVSKGKRAVSLDVIFSTGVSGMLKVGNRTDIIGVFSDVNSEKGSSIAKAIIENTKILALDRDISPNSEMDSEKDYMTVTFELTDKEALDLSLAIPNAQEIRLALRNQDDDRPVSKKQVKLLEILN